MSHNIRLRFVKILYGKYVLSFFANTHTTYIIVPNYNNNTEFKLFF